MKTITITDEGNQTFTATISPAQEDAIIATASIVAPTSTPSVEIVWDSAGSDPQPRRPVLPLRVSGYDQPAGATFSIEARNGQTENDWQGIGEILPDTVATFDVGMNAQALRCVASNLAGSAAGNPLMLA